MLFTSVKLVDVELKMNRSCNSIYHSVRNRSRIYKRKDSNTEEMFFCSSKRNVTKLLISVEFVTVKLKMELSCNST